MALLEPSDDDRPQVSIPGMPDPGTTVELTPEQSFHLRSFELQVDKMNLDQARLILVDIYKQMMIKDTLYRHLIKHQWGMDND